MSGMQKRGTGVGPVGARRLLVVVALVAALSLSGCSFGTGLETALSQGAEETETVTTSLQNPDIPAGQVLFFATWFEETEVVAGDVNAKVVEAIREAEGEVSCQEVPPREASGSDAPSQDCEFTWSDGREGSYLIEGGGIPNEDAASDVDGVAINLSAEYPES